jgi:hypothetical protein
MIKIIIYSNIQLVYDISILYISININIENSVVILKYYINYILAILIYHIKRNLELMVEEILNPITFTYENYLKNIEIAASKTVVSLKIYLLNTF